MNAAKLFQQVLWLPILFSLCVPALAQPIEVRLDLSPGSTLPALPVAMRVSVKNVSAAPAVVQSMVATMTGGGSSVTASVSLPTAWAPEVSHQRPYTIEPDATLECVAPIDPHFAENELFYTEELPLWRPGEWRLAVTVFTLDGASATSDVETLTVVTPRGDDAAIWQQLSKGGDLPFSSQTLLATFSDIIAEYPSSQYYRHVAPFARNALDRDDDRYAANLMAGVQGLPGAFIDGARLAIAGRYRDRAGAASLRNRQSEAGDWSAKGRVYAQQLIDEHASPFGPLLGAAMLPRMLTTEQWQAFHDEAHTGRTGWEPAPCLPDGEWLTVQKWLKKPHSGPPSEYMTMRDEQDPSQ